MAFRHLAVPVAAMRASAVAQQATEVARGPIESKLKDSG